MSNDVDSIGSHIGNGGQFDPEQMLKPCPCCGAPGYMIAGVLAYKVKCTGCELQTKASEYRADVIAAWNRRTEAQCSRSDDLQLVARRIVEWVRAGDADDDLDYLNGPDGWADIRETAQMARDALASGEPRP